MDGDQLLTTREAAAFLRLRPGTIENYRYAGEGPRFVRVGRRAVRYRVTDLEAWMNREARDTEPAA